MRYASFESIVDALAYRKNHGGWVFINDWSEAFWFSLEFTPSRILTHRLLSGMSGRLV